jgi:hypothetical protein
MKVSTIVALALAASLSTAAIAQTAPADKKDSGSLSEGAKEAMPKATGGTSDPTAKPMDKSLSTGAEEKMPANDSGSTNDPTAKPTDNSLSGKAEDDMGKK